jgi:uncharacterized protein YndB with AHSA1/START domain
MNEAKFKVDKNVLTVERSFNAPVDLVWKAWTRPELLDQWWAPQPWKSETKEMNFVEGGHRLYAMVGPEGEKHWGRTNYTKIVPEVKFDGDDVFCDENGAVNEALPVANFTNSFLSKGDKTQLIMVTHYASEADLEAVIKMGMKEGLTMTMNQLDELFAAILSKK